MTEATSMINLRDLLGTGIKSNLFQLHSSVQVTDISALAEEKNFTQVVLDGSQISNKAEFIQHFGMVTQAPHIFIDWDYLERQLELTEWLQKELGEIIIYKHVERLFKTNRKNFDVLIDIFLHVVDFRNKKGITPLIVLLQGDEPFKTTVPLKLVTLS